MKNTINMTGEPEIGSIISFGDYLSVLKEIRKFHCPNYDHHEIIKSFESEFSKRVGARYALYVNSCATGIDMVLKYLSLKASDEVLCCAINFHGTHLSIINSGAKLVLVEANQDLNIDISDLKNKLSSNTKAIVVTHMNGLSCGMRAIRDLVKGTDIKIVEDAARALGGKYHNEEVGKDSWACIYSFQYKKIMTTLGEGGMIVTNDQSLYSALNNYRSFGMGNGWGSNYKMTSVQAAMGLSQLKRLDTLIMKRRKIARSRTKYIREKLHDFVYPTDDNVFYNAYYLYTILVPEGWSKSLRDKLILSLSKKGINCVIANPPTYLKNSFIATNCDISNLPKSERIGERIICLPIHPAMTNKEKKYISQQFIDTVYSLQNGD